MHMTLFQKALIESKGDYVHPQGMGSLDFGKKTYECQKYLESSFSVIKLQ